MLSALHALSHAVGSIGTAVRASSEYSAAASHSTAKQRDPRSGDLRAIPL
ncbi:hypothetical protein [Rhizobium sp. SSA_523]|nr:hypothetical protein [Rhizobium sp. SSA_523]MCO5730881.1 hypothetical protein [Rhizobium sp. SSA_523]WKC24303.1 hypothetical protein QTJ18_09540 [Rhizobium sp. SSA_523]